MGPPCIRNLESFREKGCPRKPWREDNGCPAWIEISMSIKGGTERLEIKECLDLYMARLHYSTNALLEGNQQAIETFRNNMTVPGSPKPDPAMLKLVKIMIERREATKCLDMNHSL